MALRVNACGFMPRKSLYCLGFGGYLCCNRGSTNPPASRKNNPTQRLANEKLTLIFTLPNVLYSTSKVQNGKQPKT
jgi:hypothetical protein